MNIERDFSTMIVSPPVLKLYFVAWKLYMKESQYNTSVVVVTVLACERVVLLAIIKSPHFILIEWLNTRLIIIFILCHE